MMKIDKEKIEYLREEIKLFDRPVLTRWILDELDDWITWDDVGIFIQTAAAADTLYLNKTESIYEHVSPVRFVLDADVEAQRKNFGGNKVNTTQFEDGDSILASQRTIIISNYEDVEPLCFELLQFLVDTFHIKMDGHGVWPATINNYSGHVHIYCGLEGSNWYHPRCDGPNNFIFQLQGKQKITVYNNRATSLTNVELDPLDTIEERKAIYDKFEILDEIIIEPGDMMYIPNRQFYHIEPLENTISMSIPLMLTGPLTVAF